MQRINPISFKGTIQNPKNNENNKPISQSIKTELGENALPICDKSLAINPLLPSELLNESDLSRYKTVQAEWAKDFAQRYNLPLENVVRRLPEIKIPDVDKEKDSVKKMIKSGTLGHFVFQTSAIEMNPIRELVNLNGGDEGTIVHESIHGFFHNLRRDYSTQFTDLQLRRKAATVIKAKMLEGEFGSVLKHCASESSDKPITIKLIEVPLLSKKERIALIETINEMTLQHIDDKPLRLNDAAREFLKENLLPRLTDYSQTIPETSKSKDSIICEELVDYIDSFFFRRDAIIDNCKAGIPREVLPLTEVEQTLASRSFDETIDVIEGNYLIKNSKGASSKKAYFMAPEEMLARKESSIFRLNQVNQTIKGIEAQAIKPSKVLLDERQKLQHNIRLIELAENIGIVEKQIVSAERKIKKVQKLNIKRTKITTKYGIKNPNEIFETMHNKSVLENVSIIFKMVSFSRINKPIRLLANTKENKGLKLQLNTLMKEILEVSSDTDLTSVPSKFYKNLFKKVSSDIDSQKILKKWLKRLS